MQCLSIFVLVTKIITLCLSSSQSITCTISPCISQLYMSVYLMFVSISTWKQIMYIVNIFKSIYIKYMDSDREEQCTACPRLLHILSFLTVLHQCLKISARISHYLTQFVPFWTVTQYWGPQAASHPPQVVPFPGDTLSIANSGRDPLKSNWMDQKENNAARGIIHIGLISLHLAAFRAGFKLNAPASVQR